MICYHTTIVERIPSIWKNGLVPGSDSLWWKEPVQYVMLSPNPWWDLNGEMSVVLEVSDPAIKPEYFEDPEGLRWWKVIEPKYLRIISESEYEEPN